MLGLLADVVKDFVVGNHLKKAFLRFSQLLISRASEFKKIVCPPSVFRFLRLSWCHAGFLAGV
jgi:hypothetical protein